MLPLYAAAVVKNRVMVMTALGLLTSIAWFLDWDFLQLQFPRSLAIIKGSA